MMYEFTKKETRNKFNRTKLGKQINKFFYSTLILFIISVVCMIFIHIKFVDNDDLRILSQIITFIFLTLLVYLDGKRDGAISQYKLQK